MRIRFLAGVAALVAGGAIMGSVPAQDEASVPGVGLRIVQVTVAPDGAIQALVTPTDGSGRVLRDLTAANFRMVVDDSDLGVQSVSAAARGDNPLSIVIAIDVSGSMRQAGLQAAVAGASSLLDRLGERDRCCLLAFGAGVRQVCEFTGDIQRVRSGLEGLQATDQLTFLYQALFEGLDRAASAPTKRVAVVALTDGKDDGSPVGLQEVLAKLAARDVPVYTLAYGPNADAETLRRLSAASRGVFYSAPGADDVTRAYSDISDELRGDYLIASALPAPAQGPIQVAIALEYRGETASGNLSVTPASATMTAAPREPEDHRFPLGRLIGIAALVLVLVAAGAWIYLRMRKRQGPALDATMVPPRAWIEIVKGPDAGQKALLFGKEAVIGRDPVKCQVVIKNDMMVGRQHARLKQDDQGNFVLHDLESQNGVQVNGVRISEPVTLQSEDRIVIGLTELLFIDQR